MQATLQIGYHWLSVLRDGNPLEFGAFHTYFSGLSVEAGIAQLVEQLICNQQVVGSNPAAGSSLK